MNQLTIAIDGPASSGKSTVAKITAKKLGLVYIDTGAMYRTIAYEAIKQNTPLQDEKQLTEIAKNTAIHFEQSDTGQKVFSNGLEVTEAIRQPDVTNAVSQVAAVPEVREELVRQQRDMARNHGVVMDGRDIGTVVLPKADLKFFLVASVEERAERRYEENLGKGISTPLDQLTKEIEERDYKDAHRQASPLKQADDAILLDTTSLSIEEVVKKILETAENHLS